MAQQLILPINKARLTASWATEAYRLRFGFNHYGADMVSAEGNTTLYASGEGTVVVAGLDSVVGNVVAVLYKDARNRVTGKSSDVVLRYFHLAKISVKAGQSVTKDTMLGTYGNTGQLSTGAHLHLEADTDVQHPLYSPTVKSSSLLKGSSAGANDKSMTNPLEWLFCKATAPDNQTYTTANDVYIRTEDKTIEILAELTAEEITVDNAITDGVIASADKTLWLNVLLGKAVANPASLKTIFDRYHAKMK